MIFMYDELAKEVDYTLNTLIKSGFYSADDILEILEEQFISEDINVNEFKIQLVDSSNANFSILEEAFTKLTKEEDIISIHNCGYNIEEGVYDAFELFIHLKNLKFNPIGFCFYTFEDIESAICKNSLKITFGDFENNESKALEIGKLVKNTLESFNFSVNWNESINTQIEINNFIWDKSFNKNKDYEIEGAFELFKNSH